MRLPALLLALLAAAPALAQTTAPAPAPTAPATQQQPANEQVIVPEVQRRDVRIPRFP